MRTYGGRTAQQRREERRRTLLDVGRELWCEQGWAAVTMRGVCARAELSDRYFYESFADREALLVAIAEDVRDETVGLLLGTGIDPQTDSQVLWLRRALEITSITSTRTPAAPRSSSATMAAMSCWSRCTATRLRPWWNSSWIS